jgi:hypothetical protein
VKNDIICVDGQNDKYVKYWNRIKIQGAFEGSSVDFSGEHFYLMYYYRR